MSDRVPSDSGVVDHRVMGSRPGLTINLLEELDLAVNE